MIGLVFRYIERPVEIKRRTAVIKQAAEIGRVQKMENFPFDIMRDRRKAVSMIGPRMNAKTRGASSYLNFLKIYPTIPNITMTTTS